ncbi:hypothetical protein HMPREF9714_02170 [Myroides odoratimimus CCUG 12901]|nr:hypothetical protein HMPREF9714_02170 [Myroides odoratimimus CCUG 12901]
MKKKLRFISYLLITLSLFILINLVYRYNTRNENFNELNKEIFISLDIPFRIVPVISEYLCHLFRSNRATIPFRIVPVFGLICAT